MKITCSKKDLLKGVNTVAKAVPTRTTFPILECILIDASADTILLDANDTELGIETHVDGTIEERGKIALDAKMFSDIVRKLPDNDVTIETNNSMQTTITCEKANFKIVGKDGDEFEFLPYVERIDPITMSEFTLKEVIQQTIFAIAPDDNNKLMTGELFSIHDNELMVVALDGHRVSIRNIELKKAYESHDIIVPGKTLQELSRILNGESDSMVKMYTAENHVLFEFDGTTVVSSLIDGNYFRIREMLSNDYETCVKVNKKELLDCLERASLMVRETDKKPVIFDVTDGVLYLRIRSMIGTMKEDMEIEKEGKDIRIGLNPKFMTDVLRVIDDETVTLYLINRKAPCFIKDEEETYIYFVLPVNFNESEYEDI